jgi:hypothetical protein
MAEMPSPPNATPREVTPANTELESMDKSLLQVVNSGWRGLEIVSLVAHQHQERPPLGIRPYWSEKRSNSAKLVVLGPFAFQ